MSRLEAETLALTGFCFKRKEHLKRNGDIRALFSKGKKVGCSGAKLFFQPNGSGESRIAFTFARKYGNAVARNHSRRLSRECYRLIKHRLKTGFDMALLIYPGGDVFLRRSQQLDTLFSKAALFLEQP